MLNKFTHCFFPVLLLGFFIMISSCNENSTPKENKEKSVQKTDSAADLATTNVRAGYAPVNGLKMYYEIHGNGKPIVLIHGSFMTIPMWKQIIPLFAKTRQVIVMELQGHGRTADIERDVSFEGMADDVSELLKFLKIDSADILGYSMGGGVAFQMGIRHPGQVRKLIITSGVYKHDGWWPAPEKAFAGFNAAMFKNTPIEAQYDSLAPDPKHFPEFIKRVASINLKPYDWTQQVRQMKAPVLIMLGDADGVRYEHALELFRMKGGGKMAEFGGMSDSRLAIFPGTTHWQMIDRLDWLVPIVNEFLDAKPH